jgi:hypothetical protein
MFNGEFNNSFSQAEADCWLTSEPCQNEKVIADFFSNKPISLDTYYFPSQIAEAVGFSPNYINNLKRVGCHFHGRKTTIRHVRSFLAKRAQELV